MKVIRYCDSPGTYAYYMHYAEDALAIRFLVAGIWILDTLRFSFVCHFLYYYLITNYGIPMSLLYLIWSLPASVLVHATVATAVQCFFAHQIYYLCRPQVRWWVTAPIMLSVLAATGLGVAAAILEFLNTETSLSMQISFHIGTPALAAYMLAEILITVSLCTLVYDSGSRSAYPRTKRLLNTLIVYAVNRCFLILLVTMGELAANVNHQDGWVITLDFIGQGLYPNSLLASLNARQYLRTQASGTMSDPRISAVNFTRSSKLQGDAENSQDGTVRFQAKDEAVINITADPSLGKITALRVGVEV
ncbi:hypothetical protein EDD17DRAFT_212152 [Pisolithus thermaeus]|nr:hypothetical protein EV401DRAFT_912470 [Pisolithus croceorrhizus]KAI6143182.1 hypothetical protein EDD17DRAFT_212152 [Pisolithus thermaeus]